MFSAHVKCCHRVRISTITLHVLPITGSQQSVNYLKRQPELLVKPHGQTFRTLSFTCTLDGLDHFVGDDAPSKSGAHTALCGHPIQVVALVSPPGPACPRCTQLVTALRAASSNIRPFNQRRDGRLRRLLDYLQTLTLPKLDGHPRRRPTDLTLTTPQTRRVSRATVLARYHPGKTT